MNTNLLFKLVVTFVIFFLLDKVYLVIMREKIKYRIEKVQNEELKIYYRGQILLYILILIALYLFIIEPNANYLKAFFLGFIIQGSIQSTNLTVFRDWSYKITLIDTLFGGLQTLLSVYLARQIV